MICYHDVLVARGGSDGEFPHLIRVHLLEGFDSDMDLPMGLATYKAFRVASAFGVGWLFLEGCGGVGGICLTMSA